MAEGARSCLLTFLALLIFKAMSDPRQLAPGETIITPSAAQEAKLPAYRDRWVNIGLSVGKTDFTRAETDILKMYALNGTSPRRGFIRLSSPIAGGTAASLLTHIEDILQRDDKAPPPCAGPVLDALLAVANWAVKSGFYLEQVKDKPRLRKALLSRAELTIHVLEIFSARLKDKIMPGVYDQLWHAGYGYHDAAWLGFYEFFAQECGVVRCEQRLRPLMRLAEIVGWWWPFEEVCVVTEQYSVLERDARGRLHSTRGPAVSWPDGHQMFAVHGVRVPERVILQQDKTTPRDILAEPNTEVRRVMVELYGGERFMRDAGGRIIHTDETGKLWRKKMPDGTEDVLMVEVVNSTPEPDGSFKTYWLRVDPQCRPLRRDGQLGEPQVLTARAAVASTFGFTADEYNLDIET